MPVFSDMNVRLMECTDMEKRPICAHIGTVNEVNLEWDFHVVGISVTTRNVFTKIMKNPLMATEAVTTNGRRSRQQRHRRFP